MLTPIPMLILFLYGLLFTFSLALVIGSIICFCEFIISFWNKRIFKGLLYLVLAILLVIAFQLIYVH